MAIVNVTPDSFFEGSRASLNDVTGRALRAYEDGAEVVDVGGQSTRPGATAVSCEEELERVLPAVKAIRRETDMPISVDTFYPFVAEECLKAGADMINDVSCLRFESMPEIIRRYGASICVMSDAREGEGELLEFKRRSLELAVNKLLMAGVKKERILLDGGIGFNRSKEEDLLLMERYGELMAKFDLPFLLGASRKSMFGGDVKDRLAPTLKSTAYAHELGVLFVRVHDVKENVEVLRCK